MPNLIESLHLQESLRSVLGEASKFKFRHQVVAVHHLMSTAADLLYIAPTGGGKTWVYLTAALSQPTKTMVVIVPLMALRTDLVRRLDELEGTFSYEIWNGQQPGSDPQLLLVSVEAVTSVEFSTYVAQLWNRERLHIESGIK